MMAKRRLRVMIWGSGDCSFIDQLATKMELTGWVGYVNDGILLEVEGDEVELQAFLIRIQNEKSQIFIDGLESVYLDVVDYSTFEIRPKGDHNQNQSSVLSDIAVCDDCLAEIFDPTSRRYLYPFTTCNHCGPRFSIIERLPYNRQQTSMKMFKMCHYCRAEYEDSGGRRFHHQINACPKCGPHLELWNLSGESLARDHEALLMAANAIRQGQIVAIKGLGGFQLLVDARHHDAVQRLRDRKHQQKRSFAVLYPSLAAVNADFDVSELETCLLTSSASPIVLLRRQDELTIDTTVAPNAPHLGVMLANTPLQHLLMQELGFAVVVARGNAPEEAIYLDEYEALHQLKHIADLLLVHDRPIVRYVDDSIVQVVLGREMILRRGRGYTPRPLFIKREDPTPILAVGGDVENAIALSTGDTIFPSQYLGDFTALKTTKMFQEVVFDFQQIYSILPEFVVADMNPVYFSGRYAEDSELPVIWVQHHYTHILSCMVDNELEPPVLGVSWDNGGYGLDQTIWGGEFLQIDDISFGRVAYFRQFPLMSDDVVQDPRKIALTLLWELGGETIFKNLDFLPFQSFSSSELSVFSSQLKYKENVLMTSSVGCLFTGVAWLLGLLQTMTFAGEATMLMENMVDRRLTVKSYSFRVVKVDVDKSSLSFIIDWGRMMMQILEDLKSSRPVSEIATRFHQTLVEMIVDIAKRFLQKKVVLSGECFQNRYLTEMAVNRLREEGFDPYWHQRVPPNDGGLAVGQVSAANRLYF